MDRRFEIVLFGATGFTGRLVAEYLMRGYGRDLRWAIAGRDATKLAQLKTELAHAHPASAAPEVMLADATDRDAITALARASKVVATSAGPYSRYGEPLVDACAESGTHYCDLTGEIPFIRRSIDRNHARAQATRARIIHCAGFDSIPSDLGVYMLHEHFEAHARRLASATAFFGPLHMNLSGGTLASILATMSQTRASRELRDLIFDPYALLPDRTLDRGPDRGDPLMVRYDPRIDGWTGFFEMAGINTRVVRRSNALLGFAYGKNFRYSEARNHGSGIKGLASALATTAVFAALGGAGFFAPGRALLAKLGPQPGKGPAPAARAAGHYQIVIIGEGEDLRVQAFIEGGDPGYEDTAKMLAETALIMAREDDQIPARFGVLTPAAAMASRLLERLRNAGITFDLRPPPLKPHSHPVRVRVSALETPIATT